MCVISNFIKDKIFFEVDNSDKLSIELIYCLEHLKHCSLLNTSIERLKVPSRVVEKLKFGF